MSNAQIVHTCAHDGTSTLCWACHGEMEVSRGGNKWVCRAKGCDFEVPKFVFSIMINGGSTFMVCKKNASVISATFMDHPPRVIEA